MNLFYYLDNSEIFHHSIYQAWWISPYSDFVLLKSSQIGDLDLSFQTTPLLYFANLLGPTGTGLLLRYPVSIYVSSPSYKFFTALLRH